MKKMKRFLAILMAVVMVITSVRFEYWLSNAASGEPGTEQNVAVKFTVSGEAVSGNADVTFIPDEGDAVTASGTIVNKEISLTDVSLVPDVEYAVTIKVTGDGVTYTGSTTVKVVEDTEEPGTYKTESESYSVELSSQEFSSITVSDYEKYDSISITATTASISYNNGIITGTIPAGSEITVKATVKETGAIYSKKVTLNAKTVAFDLTSGGTIEGYAYFYIIIDQADSYDANSLTVTDGSNYQLEKVENSKYKISATNGNPIAESAKITINGTKDGKKCSIEVTPSSVQQTVTLTEMEFSIEITNNSHATIQYYEGNNSNQKFAFSENKKNFANGTTVTFVVEAKDSNKVIEVEGADNAQVSLTNWDANINPWKQTATISNINADTKITISERDPKVKKIELKTTSIIPEIETLLYSFETENNIPVDSNDIKTQLSVGGESLTESTDYKINYSENKITLYYNDKVEKLLSDNDNKISATFTYKGEEISKDLTINAVINEVQYGTDYILSNQTGMYTTDGKSIYYSGDTASIKLLKGNYKKYRYAVGNSPFNNEFQDITDTSEIKCSVGSKIRVQMISDNTFGKTGEIEFIKDDAAPDLSGSSFSIVDKAEIDKDGRYVVTDGHVIKLAPVADNTGGSGIEKVYYKINDSEYELTVFGEEENTFLITNLPKASDVAEITVYAVDNVGNESGPITLKYLNDDDGPSIEVAEDLAPAFYAQDELTYYYSYADNKEGTFSIIIKDDHLKKVSVNGAEQTISNGESCTYSFKIDEDTKEQVYEFEIAADDSFRQNTKTYKVIIDNTDPSEVAASAAPIEPIFETDVKDISDIFSEKLIEEYAFYNNDGKLIVSFIEDFYESNEVSFNGVSAEIEVSEDTGAGSSQSTSKKWIGEKSLNQIQTTSAIYESQQEYTFSVTDTAKNTTTVDILANDTPIQSSKKVALIYDPINLKSLEVNEDEYVIGNNTYYFKKDGTDDLIAGTLKYDFGDSSTGVADADFLQVYLKKSNSNDFEDFISCDVTGNSEGEFSFTVKAAELENAQEYEIVAYYFDAAANGVKKITSQNTYVFDNQIPVITCKKIEDEKAGTMTLIYTLTESHPDFNNFTLNVSGKNNVDTKGTALEVTLNGSQEKVNINDLLTRINDSNAWVQTKGKNDEYTLTISILKEGTYRFELQVKDFVHEAVGSDTGTFRYDVSAPAINAANVMTTYDSTNLDYSQFDPKQAEIELSAYDLASQSVSAVCKAYNMDLNFTVEYNCLLNEGPDQEGIFTGKTTIDANFKGTLEFIFSDDDGHVSKTVKYTNNYGDIGLVIEDEEMHLNTSSFAITELNSDSARNNIYNEDVKLNLFAMDSYSGIKSIVYSINGNRTNAELNQNGNVITGWTQNIIVPATKANEGNHVPVVLEITDNAGHVNTETKEYMIDITAPVISVTYDNNSPLNDVYYNATRTMIVSINEYNFDPAGVKFSVTRDGVPMTITPNFHTDGVTKTDKDGKPYYTYIMNVPFDEDGDYEVTLSATDLAGNVSDYSQVDTFTIDKTLPEMTITYDNNSPYRDNYYGEARTATITVREHNFDASNIQVNVTASLNGESITAPSVSAFSTNGDVHTASVVFNKDADYTISATCMDLAGNEGNSIEEQAFVVDLTDPEIEITGVVGNESYTGSVNPIVTVTDGNYNADGVTISIVGGKHGAKEVASDISDIAHGQTFSYANIQQEPENDDCYVLTATAIDMAGHESEATVSYRVNRFGSVYMINDELQAAVDAYYAPASDQYAIIEENVDELDSYTLTYTVDNEIVNLEEGTDYSVYHTTNNDDWQQYEYSLNKETFEREGIYNISISSKDTVGNVTDNKSKELNIEFCIDNTKPVCIVSGVQDGQEFEKDEAANIVIEAYDNIKFSDMQVMVNGNQVASEADMVDGKVSFTIDPTDGEQTLTVVCHDAAGNEELQEMVFHFKVGGFTSSWQIILLIILLVLAILAVLFFIFLKKRNKEEQ